jgi:hypothetical protein
MSTTLYAPPKADTTARAFLDALARRDFSALRWLLADDVWFRILLPRQMVETHTAAEAVAAFHQWYGIVAAFEVQHLDHHTMAGREFVAYRFRLRPAWAPDQWHLIEQSGYVRVRDGRISRLDLVCTGFHAVDPA